MRIGFLGLGKTGMPMARNLLGLEHTVTVYDRTPGKAKALITFGAKEATSLAEAVRNAEVVITMPTDDTEVRELVHGPSGLIQNLPPKGIHLCMGSIEVETSTSLASAHAQAGQGYVAAPVLGRADITEPRHIWIVVGGPESQVNRCRPLLEALGRGYTRVGSNAALAHALKLGSDRLRLAMELAVSEILTFAKKAGLPPADYLRLLNTAIFRSHMVHDYGSAVHRPSFDPEDRTLDLAGNELMLQTAKDTGVDIPVVDLLNVRLQAAGARGWGEQDLAELSQIYLKETGIGEASPPEPMAQPPIPPVSKPPRRSQRELVRAAESKGAKPQEKGPRSQIEKKPPPEPPQVVDRAKAKTSPVKASEPVGPDGASPAPHLSTYPAMADGIQVMLDLNHTSHFEVIKGHVWAWSQGKRYETPWRNLDEVELAFKHVLLLPIKRHVLLRPEAVLDLRLTFGGWGKARVDPNLELNVSRACATRLKDLLGL